MKAQKTTIRQCKMCKQFKCDGAYYDERFYKCINCYDNRYGLCSHILKT